MIQTNLTSSLRLYHIDMRNTPDGVAISHYKFSGEITNGEELEIFHINATRTRCQPFYEMSKKQVIFVVDVSASMYYVLDKVKASLKAFQKFFRRDENACILDINIVTFSEKARVLWTPASTKTFENAVNGMDVEGATNMVEGLRLAFSLKEENLFTWIVVLTDGIPNRGDCQTLEAFDSFTEKCQPEKSKIITIGYGSDFDPEILDKIGEFTYFSNIEDIPKIFGGLAEEISTTFIFDAQIHYSGEAKSEVVIGDPYIGNLYNNRGCIVGFINAVSISRLTYYSLEDGGYHTQLYFGDARQANDGDVYITKKAYFDQTAGEMILDMYTAFRTKGNVENLISKIRLIVQGKIWQDSAAAEQRENVLRIATGILSNEKNVGREAVHLSAVAKRQVSYTMERLMTPGMKDTLQNFSPDH